MIKTRVESNPPSKDTSLKVNPLKRHNVAEFMKKEKR